MKVDVEDQDMRSKGNNTATNIDVWFHVPINAAETGATENAHNNMSRDVNAMHDAGS